MVNDSHWVAIIFVKAPLMVSEALPSITTAFAPESTLVTTYILPMLLAAAGRVSVTSADEPVVTSR
jgi:hypothetical protein